VYMDNDLGKLKVNGMLDSDDDSQEKSLRWLLDMDLSEPEEKLFTVAVSDHSERSLSAYEADIANRPLFRGHANRDDLASYIDEEIVISSAVGPGDIYSRRSEPVEEKSTSFRTDDVMAIDFARGRNDSGVHVGSVVADGADILGLLGDDDIGEKFVSIKRVKSPSANGASNGAINDASEDDNAWQSQESVLELDSGERAASELTVAILDHTVTAGIHLTEAPVPTQISVPGGQAGANDGSLVAAIDHASVLDYVASMPQPADDGEFDTYLLRGEHLPNSDFDPEELVVTPTEGVISVDPSSEISIDYHEDFHNMGGFDQDSFAAIANVITPVMEEISSAVRARLAAIGLAADAVAVDVKLGSDEASIKECYAQGYEPVHSVFFEVSQPLLSIDQAARDTIYVRLLNVQGNENWNHLFSVDFAVSNKAESVIGESFCEDIFGESFADDISALQLSDTDVDFADIEAAFSNLAHSQDEDEICGVGFRDFEDSDSERQGAINGASGSVQDCSAVELQVAVQEQPDIVASSAGADVSELVECENVRMGGVIPDYISFNFTSQSNTEIFTEFLDAFIEEGSAEVEKLENEVGEWEKNVAGEALFAKVSRTLHTIKGIAKGVGLQRLGTLVHNFETLLDKMPRPNVGAEQSYFHIVNAWLDAVVRGVEHVVDTRSDVASELPDEVGAAALRQESEQVVSLQTDGAQSQETVLSVVPGEKTATIVSALDKRRDQQLADEGAKALAAQQSVRITSDKLDHLLNLASQAQQLGVRASQTTSRSKRSSAELQARLSSVRTHIRKIADKALLNVNVRPGSSNPDLDALEMDQYSELQEAASILREGVEDLADLVDVVSRQNMQIETLLKQQSSVISGISSSIQGARVVPVSRLMPGLRRIVRTVSTDLGKVVAFKVLNETGALDRDHYARLQVILEHMVRNALDHGIESPEQRVAMGKPTGGRITIDVRKSGGDYLIRLSDDGKGIDPDAIREAAYEKGLDVDVDALSDEEAIRLIFHKGFSTASTLSEISGRGVGLDIVLTELQQIGGDVQIQSAVGLGTAFDIRIPSNVSVNGALLVAAAGESYAIPLNGLIAVEQVPVEEFFAAVDERSTLSLSGMECEPAYLATLCQGLGLPDRGAWNNYVPVIVAGSANRYMAIAIDNLQEALELVVRSLGAQFTMVPGVAGAATTAEGEAIVALDLNLLVASAGADGIAQTAVAPSKSTTLLALVVDDSRTQRMVATSQLDTVGVETVTAENGLVAIDLLNATHRLPDIILLDVEMPVKDGIQTLREIRKSRRYGHLPVIMVTSRTGAKHRTLANDAGCNAYMGKPFNFPALIKQINELTGHDLQLS
jgi:chemotaxis protein histidine kinase CheA